MTLSTFWAYFNRIRRVSSYKTLSRHDKGIVTWLISYHHFVRIVHSNIKTVAGNSTLWKNLVMSDSIFNYFVNFLKWDVYSWRFTWFFLTLMSLYTVAWCLQLLNKEWLKNISCIFHYVTCTQSSCKFLFWWSLNCMPARKRHGNKLCQWPL